MSVETQITFRGIAPFDHARDIVHNRLARMAPTLPRGARCDVLLERVSDPQQFGSRRIHARVQLVGTGLSVATVAREDDGVIALRMALARAEERLLRQRGQRSPALVLHA